MLFTQSLKEKKKNPAFLLLSYIIPPAVAASMSDHFLVKAERGILKLSRQLTHEKFLFV